MFPSASISRHHPSQRLYSFYLFTIHSLSPLSHHSAEATMAASTNKRSRSSSRSGLNHHEDDDGDIIHCSGCHADVSTCAFAELIAGRGESAQDCHHRLCMECFGMAHAERGADLKLCCRGSNCSYSTISWNVHSITGRSGRRRITAQSIIPPSSHGQRIYHPNLFYNYQSRAYRDRFSILSLVTKSHTDPNRTNCYVAELRHDQ